LLDGDALLSLVVELLDADPTAEEDPACSTSG
jgi:hypothetical protein